MNRVRFPMDDNADNIEDLKTHGYIFSDSDSESSSDNDTNDSTTVSNRNYSRGRPKLKTSVLTDSAQSSGLSDFDDDYYAVQPPALPLNEFHGQIVKIKAKKSWADRTKASRYYAQHSSKSTNSKNASEVEPVFGISTNDQGKQIINTQAPLKNVWSTTYDLNNHLKAQVPDKKIRIGDKSCTLANNSTGKFSGRPSESTYLKEFPPLPQPKRNGINQSTNNDADFSCVSDVTNNVDDYLQKFSSLSGSIKNVRERSATPTLPTHTDEAFRCHPEALNTKISCLQEFPSLQPNESGGVGVNASPVRDINIGLNASELRKRANDFTFSQELPSPDLNRIRRLSSSSSSSIDITENIAFLPNALHTTLIGGTQEGLCYSKVSKEVNDLTYSEELLSLPELNQNRRLSSSSSLINVTENIACLSNALQTALIGGTQEDLCYSKVSKGVNDLTYSEELLSLPELNKNRRLSSSSSSIDTTENIACLPNALHTPLIGGTQEDLRYSKVSKGVNDLTYSEELLSLPELNQNRRLSSSSSLINVTENIACLSNALHTPLIGGTQEDLRYSKVSKGVNDLTYSEELLSLPELNQNRRLSSSSSLINVTENIACLSNALHTALIGGTQEDLCYSKISKGVNDLTYSEELLSLPELNENRRLNSGSLSIATTENIACLPNATTLIGDIQEDLYNSEISNGLNDLAYSQELPSLPEIVNKNRRLSNASTSSMDATENMSCFPNAATLIGDIQEGLYNSEISSGVNDLAYSLELPSLPEIENKNRRLSNASTSSIGATENMSCLPGISHPTSSMSNIDYFFTFFEDTENKNLHHKSNLLFNYLYEQNSTNTSLPAVNKKIGRLDKSNEESACITEESTIPSVMENLETRTRHCSSEQILPAKSIWNMLLHIAKKFWSFSEPAANLKQEIINPQLNHNAHPDYCTSKLKKLSKNKNRLKVNEGEFFAEPTKLNSNNNTRGLISPKLIKEEIKTERITPTNIKTRRSKSTNRNSNNFIEDFTTVKSKTEEIRIVRLTPTPTKIKTRKSKSIQKGRKTEFKEHGIIKTDTSKIETEKPKVHLETNQKVHNKNPGMGPKNTINNCCDTEALLNNNVRISHRNRLVRNNNATRTRVRLAGERRRRRLYAQLYHMSDDDLAVRAFAEGIILLLVIIYVFYSVKSFLNLYLRNIFGICDNGLNKVVCY